MTELVIGRSPPASVLEGRKFQNSRFFTGVTEGVTKVYVEDGESTDAGAEIVEAYRAAKVEVVLGLPKPKSESRTAARAPAQPAG